MKIEEFKEKLAELRSEGKIISQVYDIEEEVSVAASDVELSETSIGTAVIFDGSWFNLRGKAGNKYKLRIEVATREAKGTIRKTGDSFHIEKGKIRLTAVAA